MNAAAKPAAPRPSAYAWAESFVPEVEGAREDARPPARLGRRAHGHRAGPRPGVAGVLGFLAGTIDAPAPSSRSAPAPACRAWPCWTGMAPDGVLTTIDTEPEHQAAARKVFAAAGIADRRARLIAGAALQVLPKLSDGAYDLVFVDGDPLEYVEYVEQGLRLLRPGGLLVLHHALAGGRVADESNEDDETVIIREALAAVKESEELSPVLLPLGDGLLVARRA